MDDSSFYGKEACSSKVEAGVAVGNKIKLTDLICSC